MFFLSYRLHLLNEKNHQENFCVIVLTEIYFLILSEIIFVSARENFRERKSLAKLQI